MWWWWCKKMDWWWIWVENGEGKVESMWGKRKEREWLTGEDEGRSGTEEAEERSSFVAAEASHLWFDLLCFATFDELLAVFFALLFGGWMKLELMIVYTDWFQIEENYWGLNMGSVIIWTGTETDRLGVSMWGVVVSYCVTLRQCPFALLFVFCFFRVISFLPFLNSKGWSFEKW